MKKVKNMWDERYSDENYAYGTKPNQFFKETLHKYDLKGNIFLPGEGEGRNAVYAALNGLEVTAFDISKEGKKKALKLADANNVKIQYEVGDLETLEFSTDSYDAAALIYAHFPPNIRSAYHLEISKLVKSGGHLILEGFSEGHLVLQAQNPNVGGPKKKEMLYSLGMIRSDFADFDILLLQELEIPLSEGKFHQGKAKVIRFVGRKK